MAAVRPAAQAFAACLSHRNTGHGLVSRFTGEPVEIKAMQTANGFFGHGEATRNVYYRSSEMHEDAAAVLAPAIAALNG